MIQNIIVDLLILIAVNRQPETGQTATASAKIQVVPKPVPGVESLIVVDASESAKLATSDKQPGALGVDDSVISSEIIRQAVVNRPAPAEVQAVIDQYASQYGVDAAKMKNIASCESGFRQEALSPDGIYGGLYQFVSSTWVSNRMAMGLDPNPDLRFNSEEAIKTAAFKMSRDGYGAWPVCGRI